MNIRYGSFYAVIVLAVLSIGCGSMSSGDPNSNLSANKKAKGLPAAAICQMLGHPSFESKFPYDGKGCSGSTFFGAKDTRSGSYETDNRPSFSYFGTGENETITKVVMNMSKRPDGAAFFLAEAEAVAKMINGGTLPKDIADSITAPMSTTGGDVTVSGKVGDARVEFLRTGSNGNFRISFEF